jgi:hypothetical protein
MLMFMLRIFWNGKNSLTLLLAGFRIRVTCHLHVLRKPADTLAVALAHDDGAHEDLNGADTLERNLALASCNKIPVSICVPDSNKSKFQM